MRQTNKSGKLTKTAQLLVKRRDALRAALDGEMNVLQRQSGGDVVDLAIDLVQHELSSQLVEVESRELAGIEQALDRIRRGEYGVCDVCGKKIPAARLQAVPHATTCVTCQRMVDEQRNRGEDPAWGRSALNDLSSDDSESEGSLEDYEIETR